MLSLIILSVLPPTLVGITYLALRDSRPRFVTDTRGVALQTVIVIVVLLAIAGAVAGVLLSRGTETVDRLENQEIINPAVEFTTQERCEDAGFTWTADANHANGGTCD